MRAISSLVLGAALLAMAQAPAFAHHKIGHRDFFGSAERTEAQPRHSNPCNAVSNNPHEANARQAMQRRCRHLSTQLREHPDDAELRAQCDRLARGLTGRSC